MAYGFCMLKSTFNSKYIWKFAYKYINVNNTYSSEDLKTKSKAVKIGILEYLKEIHNIYF